MLTEYLSPAWFGELLNNWTHFCFVLKGKRGTLQEHEQAALRDHMLLVLEKNFQLEQQVSPGTAWEGAGKCWHLAPLFFMLSLVPCKTIKGACFSASGQICPWGNRTFELEGAFEFFGFIAYRR